MHTIITLKRTIFQKQSQASKNTLQLIWNIICSTYFLRKNLHKRKSRWSASFWGAVGHKSCCDQVDWVPGGGDDGDGGGHDVDNDDGNFDYFDLMMTLTNLLREQLGRREAEEEEEDRMATMWATDRLE